MSILLSPGELQRTAPAERAAYPSPVPTRMISNGEFTPAPQTERQKRVEARIKELGTEVGRKHGLTRRQFLRTASGMAAAFVVMNEVYGTHFEVNAAEMRDPDAAKARADGLANQFIVDDQVHFIRDDANPNSPMDRFVGLRGYAANVLNPAAKGRPNTFEHLKFQNFVKEVYLDSDTKIALLSSAPSDNPANWFITNDQIAAARETVNAMAGGRRLLAHAVITPGQPWWLEEIDRAIATLKPDSWKGYSVGDPNEPSKYRWRLDDEKLAYPAYEKMQKAGITNICIHKGLLPANAEQMDPGVTAFARVDDVGKPAKDWPGLNFIIYHAAYHLIPKPTPEKEAEFERTGRVDWVTDLAEIPGKFGVSNVFADVGGAFALTTTTNPRYCAGLMATLVNGLGADRVLWGTDSVWFGSPQWQIEALRRIEVPEDLRKKFGWAPLGAADGLTKSAIFGYNTARLYKLNLRAARAGATTDRMAQLKKEYLEAGGERSNRAYGFVARG